MPAGMLRTIGHSTLPGEVFVGALIENQCDLLVDVRRYPGSRRYPQFGQERLFASLSEAGIRGVWREGLGGRRKALSNSINTGWRNDAFRGYADYMQTAEFAAEIEWLMEQIQGSSVVVMCAEAVPWRCHRSLIGDAVLARGVPVEDIFVASNGATSRKPHVLPSFARAERGRVWYPGECGDEVPLFETTR
jgi:uncharacterized protein (DUF488 family)